jgi:mono/diheme cytochrome c family protein
VHALWTLEGVNGLEPSTVSRALADPSREVRVSTIRLAERWLETSQPHPIQAAVLKCLGDSDWAVRRQLAATLGVLPRAERERALATMLERHGDDPVVVDATLSGLQGSEVAVLEIVLRGHVETPQRSAAITMLAATIVRGANELVVQDVFQWIAEGRRPAWQRSTLLRGAEVALLGAVPPGGGGGRGGGAGRGAQPGAPSTAEVQTPGSRGGPGGAPAFPRTGAGGRGGGRGAATPGLKLTREPALVALSARDPGEIGRRARAVLDRVEWHGKPGDRAAVAPLTPPEQQRFDTGREIYQTLCAACHQPDGRGREKLAPSLIGSEFALGPASVPIRIVLNGKEGATGLMPPIGAGLSDDQIAAALTYIRREWGHTASAVDPATVRDIRARTADRRRPWTAEELSKIAAGGGH